MEDKELRFVNVDKKYLEELERKVARINWLEGYIEGVNDVFNHIELFLQAGKRN